MKNILRFLLFVLFFLLVLAGFVFTIHNTTETALWVGVELAPRAVSVWVMLAFCLGGLAGLLLGFGLFKRIKYKIQIRQLRSQVSQNEQELTNLRTQLRNLNRKS